ncbi:MAG: methionine--tRNA ligase [Cryomorphaceae bacterium]|nr:MAG: methionine--tRNA ligase [Cryomorphaceae bacterium]
MKAPKRYTITAALPYANGPLHIGHIAGVYIPADIYARYLRMQGRQVLFVCGSDEHGAAITMRARKEGVSPREIVDRYHEINRNAFEQFGISFDIYHRTSSELHHECAQEFFTHLHNQGVFTEKESEQYYDPEAGQFLADRYILGECPKCGHPEAYGDQCEKCGSTLSPTELINPRSAISGTRPELKKTSHWYLPMQLHEEWLRTWLNDGQLNDKPHHDPKEWKNHVLGQCRSWLDGGLQERAMTRDLDWGVKVPLQNAKGKVLYVWLDAPIGYISATRQWAADHQLDWKPWWQDEDTRLVHFLAKDNIVFHCIIFPIILKSHGAYILPHNVPANEFLNLEGKKISTSRNWAVWLHEYLEDFAGKRDELRYVLNSIAPENKDSEFTWKDFAERVNNELLAILGNFINRVVVLSHKYYGGVVPEAGSDESDYGIEENIRQCPVEVARLIEGYKFREAQQRVMNLARLGNKYLTETEPWKLQKTDPRKVQAILNNCLQITANLGVLLQPFLPDTAERICKMLNLEPEKTGRWSAAGSMHLLTTGHTIGAAELLFGRIENDVIDAQVAKLKTEDSVLHQESSTQPVHTPQLADISFDDFTKLDLRVGKVLEAAPVPKTDKLMQLLVDTGLDKRTIVSGIAHCFTAQDVIGREVCVVMNLAPRKIRGIESQGMVLMAENSEGVLTFVAPPANWPAGSVVR